MRRVNAILCGLLALTIWQTSPASADDGHLYHGTPSDVGGAPDCPGGFCPLDRGAPHCRFRESQPFAVPGVRSSFQSTAPHDALTLAVRLEFATEILAEEILFLADRHGHLGTVESATTDLVGASSHVRESVTQGATPDHLSGDLENISAAIGQLDRLMDLGWSRPLALAADRVVLLQDQLAAAINEGAQEVPDGVPPVDTSPAGPFFETVPPPLPSGSATMTIPSNMQGIAELPPVDQQLALQQRTCPVTGDLLGSMGKPIKVAIGDRSIFVCCEGCVDTVRANPAQYLVETLDQPMPPARLR